MGWALRALVWRSIKLFYKRGDQHHRSGEEEPLVERRREVLSVCFIFHFHFRSRKVKVEVLSQ